MKKIKHILLSCLSLFFCALSFVFFGNSLYFYSLDTNAACLSYLYGQGYEYREVIKQANNFGGGFSLSYLSSPDFTDEEKEAFDQIGEKSAFEITSLDLNRNVSLEQKTDLLDRENALVIDSSNLRQISLFIPMAEDSLFPDKTNEIAITDLYFEYLRQYGFKSDDSLDNKTIATPSDLIGKRIGGKIITGVFKTPESSLIEENKEVLFSEDNSSLPERRKNLQFGNKILVSPSSVSSVKGYLVKRTKDKKKDLSLVRKLDGWQLSGASVGYVIGSINVKKYRDGVRHSSALFFAKGRTLILGFAAYLCFLILGWHGYGKLLEANSDKNKDCSGFKKYVKANRKGIVFVLGLFLLAVAIDRITYLLVNASLGFMAFSFSWIAIAWFSLFFLAIPYLLTIIRYLIFLRPKKEKTSEF